MRDRDSSQASQRTRCAGSVSLAMQAKQRALGELKKGWGSEESDDRERRKHAEDEGGAWLAAGERGGARVVGGVQASIEASRSKGRKKKCGSSPWGAPRPRRRRKRRAHLVTRR